MFDSLLPGHTVHVVQRGALQAACFHGDADRIAYLAWLDRHARAARCAVHAYALMGNHVHLLVTPSTERGVARLMNALAHIHARYTRRVHGCESPLRASGFEVAPVYLKRYVLACMRYIERNPVHAGLVTVAAHYRWSSHRANAFGEADALVTPHPFYYALARTPQARQLAYRAFCGG